MNILIDVLGAMVIGSMLILMMFSFQYQLSDTTNTAIYMAGMVEHMQTATSKLNSIISLAGIGISPANTIITADTNRVEFRTKWDYRTNHLSLTDHRILLTLATVDTPLGKALTISQDGSVLNDLGYIFWVDRLSFRYYNLNDNLTTTAANVRSVEFRLCFRHNAPSVEKQPLYTKLQMRCYLMNTYLQGG